MTDLSPSIDVDDMIVEFLSQTRNAVRAVIRRGDSLLVQRKLYGSGEVRFTLPGGAAEVGETLEQGLRRECLEEIGVEIEVQRLMHVADFYKHRDTVPLTMRHQIEFLFRCQVPSNYVAGNGSKPDKHQQDVVWLDPASESAELLWPESLQRILLKDFAEAPVYLGLID